MKKELIFLRTLSIMLLCVLFATQANAQGLNISGTVNDDFGPVTGASVLVRVQATVVSLTATETSHYLMYLPKEPWSFRSLVIKHKKFR